MAVGKVVAFLLRYSFSQPHIVVEQKIPHCLEKKLNKLPWSSSKG